MSDRLVEKMRALMSGKASNPVGETCFGYRNCRCTIRSDMADGMECQRDNGCPFYKSCMMHLRDVFMAQRRIAQLDVVTQWYIADKYYGGRMPWRTEVRRNA